MDCRRFAWTSFAGRGRGGRSAAPLVPDRRAAAGGGGPRSIPEDVLAAAALAAAVVEQELDGTSAARRGVSLLDVAQIAPGSGSTRRARAPRAGRRGHAARDVRHARAVAERLRGVLHEVAVRKRP